MKDNSSSSGESQEESSEHSYKPVKQHHRSQAPGPEARVSTRPMGQYDGRFDEDEDGDVEEGIDQDNPSTPRPSKRIRLILHPARSTEMGESGDTPASEEVDTSHSSPSHSVARMTVIRASELDLLRTNNSTLRDHNVTFAKENSQLKVENTKLQNAAQDFEPVRDEVGRLREKVNTLQKERDMYWQCGVEWARKEHLWGLEKRLFRNEVQRLIARVYELEGSLQPHQQQHLNHHRDLDLTDVEDEAEAEAETGVEA